MATMAGEPMTITPHRSSRHRRPCPPRARSPAESILKGPQPLGERPYRLYAREFVLQRLSDRVRLRRLANLRKLGRKSGHMGVADP